ncbi:MAG: heavy metal-associated domain-containing protein [Sulfurimonas sp.]|nr:heavy metal-associated domain-containing protein [Sulfurimonas sp.]MDD3060415.1 heavy metal-associated domain-containing protein [Sulfurimonas sp.]MDD5202667.1 heavy metal-associated domain-containing protein [Sulfurimonas sp.]
MLSTVEVNNVRCSGCANTIIKTLEKEGFEDVIVDLSCEPRKVTVNAKNEASLAQLGPILRKLGYPLCDEENSFGNTIGLKAKSFVSCAIGKFSINDNADESANNKIGE